MLSSIAILYRLNFLHDSLVDVAVGCNSSRQMRHSLGCLKSGLPNPFGEFFLVSKENIL